MRGVFLAILFLVSFLIAMALFAPLSFILRVSGLADRGVSWETATGTVTGGRISGLSVNGEAVGTAELQLKPGGLLSGALRYNVNWTGPIGTGNGQVAAAAGGRLEASDFAVRIDLASLKGMAPWIRQSGGAVRIEGGRIVFGKTGCLAADGTTWSNALSRNAAVLGDGWTEMTGRLACEGDALILPLEAAHPAGLRIAARTELRVSGPSRFEGRLSGDLPLALRLQLPLAGFFPQGPDFVYVYPTPATEPN